MRPFRPTSMKPLGNSFRAWGRARDGGVAVTVGVMTALLVGVLAIAIDLGRAYNLSTELDNAADAYSLAGATQLDQTPGSCVRAIQAAVAATTAGSDTSALVNTETFASNPSGSDVYVDPTLNHTANTNIRFLTDLAKDANGDLINYITDPDINVCDDTAEYIEVTIDQASQGDLYRVDYSFAALLGAATETFPKGYAVAGLYQLNCAVLPLMFCAIEEDPPVPGGDFMAALNSYQLTGFGMWLKAGENNAQWGPGNFAFLRLNGMSGANDLRNAIGMVNNPFACVGEEETETEPGANEGARFGFDARFDIQQGPIPDDDSQWQPSPNSVKGMYRANANQCGVGGSGYDYPLPAYDGAVNTPNYSALDLPMGLPKDECAYNGGCVPQAGIHPGRIGDGNWNINEYILANHDEGIRPFKALPLPLSSWDVDWEEDGPAGNHPDGIISRYEMYLWELDRLATDTDFAELNGISDLVDDTQDPPIPGVPGPFAQVGEYAGVQCFNQSNMGNEPVGCDPLEEDPADPDYCTTNVTEDRRVIEIFVMDCNPATNGGTVIQGNTTIPPNGNGNSVWLGTMDTFIVQPWVIANNPPGPAEHDIYLEILGPGDTVGIEKYTARNVLHLYE